MVGVAGKSKGCHTCRKRKIRCDQGRPICGQCQKSSRDCEGYEKPRVFLNQFANHYGAKDHHSAQRDHVRSPCSVEGETIVSNTASEKGTATRPADTEANGKSIVLGHIGKPVVVAPLTPRLIGYEHLQSRQALRNFLSFSLPEGAKQEVPLSWLYSILDIADDNPSLPLATAALSYGWLGHVEDRPVIVSHARTFYIGALRHLRRALSENPSSESDSLLASMECLALYEMFEFGTESEAGWLAHVSGLEAIIRLRGPQMHIAGFGNKMFMFFRTIGIFKAMMCRKSTFLTAGEWKNIPWTLNPKNEFHQYIDLAAEVPGLLERADHLAASPPPPSDHNTPNLASAHTLLNDMVSIITRINNWVDNDARIQIPEGPPRSSSLLLPSAPLHPRRHNYPSATPHTLGTPFDTLQTARLMHGVWTVQLNLLCTMHTNAHLQGGCMGLHSEAVLSRTYATSLADKISRWSDFCTQNAWQSFGPVLALFILRTAVAWYRIDMRCEFNENKDLGSDGTTDNVYSHQRELDRCLDVMDRLPRP